MTARMRVPALVRIYWDMFGNEWVVRIANARRWSCAWTGSSPNLRTAIYRLKWQLALDSLSARFLDTVVPK